MAKKKTSKKPAATRTRKSKTAAPTVVDEIDGVPTYGNTEGGDPWDDRELQERQDAFPDDAPEDVSADAGDESSWSDDVPVVTAEDLDEAERALAANTSPPLRMHPVVVALVEADPDRYVPMDDYDDDRPRCEQLPVKLTDEEITTLNNEISDLIEKERRTEQENKQIRKQLGQAEAMLKTEIRSKNDIKRDGIQMRKVPVQVVGNLKANRREVYRLDTGERVDSLCRALSFSEIQELTQMRLPGISAIHGGHEG